jgi:hypothetical protein
LSFCATKRRAEEVYSAPEQGCRCAGEGNAGAARGRVRRVGRVVRAGVPPGARF